MNNYYRITYKGIDIFKYIFENNKDIFNKWNSFINCSLDINIYEDNNSKYIFYITENGYNKFISNIYPEIIRTIDEKYIKIEIVKYLDNIYYKDDNQVVVKYDLLSYARKFCLSVRELASSYELPFFVVTNGASAISNNGCDAVKRARDCHIEWEKSNNFDYNEDWSKDNE